jgi:NADH-quinone oxidoreductase subunit C
MAETNTGPEPTKPLPQETSPAAGEPVEGVPVLPEILARARERLEAISSELQFKVFDDMLEVVLPVAQLPEIARTIRDELGYGMLMSISGVDWKTSYELVYHIYKIDSPFPIVLKCSLPHEENPEAPSLMPFWPGADFQEREVYDLMGIVFTGHPDLRRILLADDFPGHPLRKDWQPDPEYVLVPHLRVPGYSGARRGKASTGRFLNE